MSTNDQKLPDGTGVLTHDHSEVDALICELLSTLDRRDKAQSFERLDMLWARLAVHIRAEHLCLFPAILGALANLSGSSSTDAPSPVYTREALERLRVDHDYFMVELARAVGSMRELLKGEGEPSAEQFMEIRRRVLALRSRLQEHNRLEEEQIYLWPEALLSPDEVAELSARMKREIENLPPRFSS